MLSATDLTVRRGADAVVSGLAMEARPGRIYWVLGPNGAGKSSLLRVLALLDAPAAGSVRHAPPPGESFLYFHSEMTLPPASTAGAWDRLVRSLISARMDRGRTALWPAVAPGRTVGRLSTGERKRLLLDAVLRRRGPLLLDEPYEHLSPDAKRALSEALVARAQTRTVVVATNQIPPELVVDAGLRLEGGRAEAVGSAAEAEP